MDLVIPKNRLDQTAAETARKKAYVTAIILALVLASFLLVLTSPVADAEEDAPLKLDGQKTFYLEGKEVTADAYAYCGIIYVITNETESEEEMAVYGVDPAFTGAYISLNTVTVEEVAYAITGVVTAKDVTDNYSSVAAAKPLILCDSMFHFEKDCFKNLPPGLTLIAAAPSEEMSEEEAAAYTESLKAANTGYGSDITAVDDSMPCVTFTFAKGEISYPQDKYQNQEMESFSAYAGITMALPECGFEYPWYELGAWVQGESEEFAGDCASITFLDGKIYVDGADSGVSATAGSSLALTASWAESDVDGNKFGDYPLYYMWITSAIVIILFVIGIGLVVYRIVQRRNAA